MTKISDKLNELSETNRNIREIMKMYNFKKTILFFTCIKCLKLVLKNMKYPT